MPEIKREVRPIEVNYVCDTCGQGMMVGPAKWIPSAATSNTAA